MNLLSSFNWVHPALFYALENRDETFCLNSIEDVRLKIIYVECWLMMHLKEA